MKTRPASAILAAALGVALSVLAAAPAAADAVPWSQLDGTANGKLASGLSSWPAESNIKKPGDLTPESWWGNDSSWNRYSYVLNNPVKYVDPTGEAPSLRYAWRSFKHFVTRHVRKNSENASKFKTNVPHRAADLVERTIDSPDRVAVQSRNAATGRPMRMNYEKEFNKEIGTGGETIVRANTQVKPGGEEVVSGYPQGGFTIKNVIGFLAGLLPGAAVVDAAVLVPEVVEDVGQGASGLIEDAALEGGIGEHLRQLREVDEIINN